LPLHCYVVTKGTTMGGRLACKLGDLSDTSPRIGANHTTRIKNGPQGERGGHGSIQISHVLGGKRYRLTLYTV